MFDVGSRQKMIDMDSKWATTKCRTVALDWSVSLADIHALKRCNMRL